MLKNIISQELNEAQLVLQKFLSDEHNIQQIEAAAQLMADAIKANNKIISCGNGGSHCDAMHFAEELSGRYRNERRSMPAIAISDVSHISCVGNDYGFEYIFSRFVEGLGNSGDVLLGISTSGNSANVLAAIEAAHAREMGSYPTREPPFFFLKPADSLVVVEAGQTGTMPYPSLTHNLHHEIELVVAIGKDGKNISVEQENNLIARKKRSIVSI